MGSALVDILGGIGTLLVLAFFFRKVWSPRKIWRYSGEAAAPKKNLADPLTLPRILKAWSPFLLLAAFVVHLGHAPVAKVLDSFSWKHPVPGLHLQVIRTPPVVLKVLRGAGALRRLLALHARHRHLHRRPDRRTPARPVVQANPPNLLPQHFATCASA